MTTRVAGFSRWAAFPTAILLIITGLHGCGGSGGSVSPGRSAPGPDGGPTSASSSGGAADDGGDEGSSGSGAGSSTGGGAASSGVVYVCPGCFDLSDQCQAGTANDNCGLGSDSGTPTCVDCAAFGQVCGPAGECIDGSSGGGSSGSSSAGAAEAGSG